MYRKPHRRTIHERKVAKCAAMRKAKERKRMAAAESMRDVGGFTTDGCLGTHRVRLLAYPGDVAALAITVDGQHRRPRTLRGVVRCVAALVFRPVARSTGRESPSRATAAPTATAPDGLSCGG